VARASYLENVNTSIHLEEPNSRNPSILSGRVNMGSIAEKDMDWSFINVDELDDVYVCPLSREFISL
jgi:hypothetical protein